MIDRVKIINLSIWLLIFDNYKKNLPFKILLIYVILPIWFNFSEFLRCMILQQTNKFEQRRNEKTIGTADEKRRIHFRYTNQKRCPGLFLSLSCNVYLLQKSAKDIFQICIHEHSEYFQRVNESLLGNQANNSQL